MNRSGNASVPSRVVGAVGGWLAWLFFTPFRLRTAWRLSGFVLILGALLVGAVRLQPALRRDLTPSVLPVILPLEWETASRIALGAAAGLLACVLAAWILDQRPASTLGWLRHPAWVRECAFGLVGGSLAALMAFSFSGLAEASLQILERNPRETWQLARGILLGLGMLALDAAARETVFRGYLLPCLVGGLGARRALAVSALLYAAPWAAVSGVSWMGVVNLGLLGWILGLSTVRTRGLWLPWGLQLGWSLCLGLLLGFPVGGRILAGGPVRAAVEGWPLLAGGSLGPEGGWPGTLALILLLLLVYLWAPTPEPRMAEAWDRYVRPVGRRRLP